MELRISVFESFLHDVQTGESQFEEVLNIMNYNELKYLVDCAKAFYTLFESHQRITSDMEEEFEQLQASYTNLSNRYTKLANMIAGLLRGESLNKDILKDILVEKALMDFEVLRK